MAVLEAPLGERSFPARGFHFSLRPVTPPMAGLQDASPVSRLLSAARHEDGRRVIKGAERAVEKAGDITCRRCGACCHVDMIAYSSPEDIQRWEEEGRQDIIARIRDNDAIWSGDRIMNSSGTVMTSCVYLNWDGSSFFCEIYETRPLVCRNFIPGSSELCPKYYREK